MTPTTKVKRAVDSGRAQNVILLIGDGMGDSEITSARNYQFGADGRFPGIDALPLTGQYTTFALTKDGKPDYVTDSAASGSGWATGTKTYNGAVSVDIHGRPQATLLELAKKRGLKTGNITTSKIQDATPAVEASHISARSCYGPVAATKTCPEAALENGGLGSITEQILNSRPAPTSPWAAVRPPSPRPRPLAVTRASRSRSRPRSAGTRRSPIRPGSTR